MASRRVVVVGGGVAGVEVVKTLESHFSVTIIDPKNYFEIPYGALRCIVEPQFSERTIISYSEVFHHANIITDEAVGASATEVIIGSGEHIPYDFLVICTGSLCKGPQMREERIQEFWTEHVKLQDSRTVLIIGGGPVGVELAGEIVTDFPKKKVVLVHSGSRLMEFLGPKTSEKALHYLQSKSVEVILNERIDIATGSLKSPYVTSTRRVIEADMHFICIGSKLGSSWLKKSFISSALDESGRLKVNESLVVEWTTNVFAAGDITNVKEIKQGYLATRHAQIVVQNIKQFTTNPDSRLASYKPMDYPMGIVSLGRKNAVAQLPFGTFLGWIPGLIKSRDLFVSKVRKNLGLQA